MLHLDDFARQGTRLLLRLNPALARGLPWLLVFAFAFWLGGRLLPLLAPSPVRVLALSPPAPAADAGRVAAWHGFGVLPAVPAIGEAVSVLQLVGVYSSGSASADFALVEVSGQVKPWRVGQTLAGATLLRVLPRAVRVREAGGEREHPLTGPSTGMPPPSSLVAVAPSPTLAAPSVPPVGVLSADSAPASLPSVSPAVPHNPD